MPGHPLYFPAETHMEPIKHHCEVDATAFDPASTIGACVALGLCLAGVLFLPFGFKSWVVVTLAVGVVISAGRINLLTTRRRLVSCQREQMDDACSKPGRVLLLALMADGRARECRLSDLEEVRLRDFVGRNPTRLCREIRGQLGGEELVFLPLSMSGGLLRRDTMVATGKGYRNAVAGVDPYLLPDD